MWLQSKDERRLLKHYFITISESDKKYEFSFDDLLGCIKSKEYSYYTPSDDDQQDVKGYAVWCKDCHRILVANKSLKERGLAISSNLEFKPSEPITISLTITGYDLGRKYNSWFIPSGLWFAEYKDHWFWLIISYIAGIISVLLVNWLSKA